MPVDILCLGEPMVEFNETEPGHWLQGFGGDVSNVAIAARRQGSTSAIVTRLGTDGFGDALMALWQDEGVETNYVARDGAAPTGLYFVRHGPEGHQFEYRRAGSAASQMSPDHLSIEAIQAAGVLHLSGISQAISDTARAACFAAIEIAHAAGTRVSYDPNLRLSLWPMDVARDTIHQAMAQTDIALPGLEDAQLLTGLSDPREIVAFYRDLGAGIVALTLGAQGAIVAQGERVEAIPPRPANLVDATGAGDCFDGSFLARLLQTADAFEAARYAVTSAALSVEGHGAVASIPTAVQVSAAS